MRKMKFSLITTIFICGWAVLAQSQDTLNAEKADSASMIEVEYDLVVFEPGFEMFLMSQLPMEHYSSFYYKNWNIQYVQEWNIRARTNKLAGAYQEVIDYSLHIDYGIELNYKLYYFFRFIEHKYGITLIHRGK